MAEAEIKVKVRIEVDVRLETKGGCFVCNGSIPPFHELPEVLLWGTRVFQFDCQLPTVIVYREAFAVALVRWDSNEEQAT
jgi:hypothetical protein